MSQESGHILRDQQDDFGKDETEGGDGGPAAGGPAAGGFGVNEGDIDVDIDAGTGGDARGGDAFGGDGGDATSYEEYTYTETEGPSGTHRVEEHHEYKEYDDHSARSGDADSGVDYSS